MTDSSQIGYFVFGDFFFPCFEVVGEAVSVGLAVFVGRKVGSGDMDGAGDTVGAFVFLPGPFLPTEGIAVTEGAADGSGDVDGAADIVGADVFFSFANLHLLPSGFTPYLEVSSS